MPPISILFAIAVSPESLHKLTENSVKKAIPVIFINKGGVVTGEYIAICEIRKEVVDKHNYTIQSIVNIPCSLILDNGDRIITVDHREPKLKVLKDFYEVYFKFDKTVHDRKYDIRKYAKMLV